MSHASDSAPFMEHPSSEGFRGPAPLMAQSTRYGARMGDKTTLGQRLVKMRTAAGLTQSELARVARVGRNTIIRIESDQPTSPTLRTLERLARACGRPVTELTEAAFEVSSLDTAIEEFERLEALRPILRPTREEIAWLRRLPPALWRELPPSVEVIELLIRAERAVKK